MGVFVFCLLGLGEGGGWVQLLLHQLERQKEIQTGGDIQTHIETQRIQGGRLEGVKLSFIDLSVFREGSGVDISDTSKQITSVVKRMYV